MSTLPKELATDQETDSWRYTDPSKAEQKLIARLDFELARNARLESEKRELVEALYQCARFGYPETNPKDVNRGYDGLKSQCDYITDTARQALAKIKGETK